VARRVQTYPKLFLRFLRDMPLEEEAELLGEDESEMDISQMHVRGSQLRCPVGKPGFWFDLAKPALPAAATAAAAAHSQSEPPASLRCCRCWLGWWCGCAEPAITDGAAVEPSASHSSSAAGASPRGEPKQASWSSPPVSAKRSGSGFSPARGGEPRRTTFAPGAAERKSTVAAAHGSAAAPSHRLAPLPTRALECAGSTSRYNIMDASGGASPRANFSRFPTEMRLHAAAAAAAGGGGGTRVGADAAATVWNPSTLEMEPGGEASSAAARKSKVQVQALRVPFENFAAYYAEIGDSPLALIIAASDREGDRSVFGAKLVQVRRGADHATAGPVALSSPARASTNVTLAPFHDRCCSTSSGRPSAATSSSSRSSCTSSSLSATRPSRGFTSPPSSASCPC
jgi:hypothetical protein